MGTPSLSGSSQMTPMRLLAPLLGRVVGRGIAMRRSQFDALPKVADRAVFLGDSITEFGQWDEWFPDLPTLNRGIGGDTVDGVLQRLNVAVFQPRVVSLLIGTNDLSGLGRSHKVADIAAQLDTLLAKIRELAPDTLLLVNSVMPRAKSLADDVQLLNERFQQLATKYGATWVDVWSALAGPDQTMRKDCSGDGIHLNGAGYQIWTDVLRPHLGA